MSRITDELRNISVKHSKDHPKLMDLLKEIEQQRNVIDELKKQVTKDDYTNVLLQFYIQKL